MSSSAKENRETVQVPLRKVTDVGIGMIQHLKKEDEQLKKRPTVLDNLKDALDRYQSAHTEVQIS